MEKIFKFKAFLLVLFCVFNCAVLCFSFSVACSTFITRASNQTETGFKIDRDGTYGLVVNGTLVTTISVVDVAATA